MLLVTESGNTIYHHPFSDFKTWFHNESILVESDEFGNDVPYLIIT